MEKAGTTAGAGGPGTKTSIRSVTEWIHPRCVPQPQHTEYLRELMSYAMLCPHSSNFPEEYPISNLQWASPLHWSRQFEWPWALYYGDFQKDQLVLDIGGCWSVFGYAMAKRADLVTVTDVDSEALQKGNESASKIGVKMNHVQADARNLQFKDNSFDRVTCISVLEHVPGQHVQCFKEMYRILKPGGIGLVTLDVKLRGVRHNDSFIDVLKLKEILDEAGLADPDNMVTLHSSLPGDDGNPLVFTVFMIRFVKGI